MPTPMAMEMESNASPTAASPAPRSPGRQAPVAGTPHSQSQDRDRVGVSSSSGPATCASCRSKHLKCDGLPVCSRCYSRGINCVYLKSRRGYRGPSGGARGGKQQPGSVNGRSAPRVQAAPRSRSRIDERCGVWNAEPRRSWLVE